MDSLNSSLNRPRSPGPATSGFNLGRERAASNQTPLPPKTTPLPSRRLGLSANLGGRAHHSFLEEEEVAFVPIEPLGEARVFELQVETRKSLRDLGDRQRWARLAHLDSMQERVDALDFESLSLASLDDCTEVALTLSELHQPEDALQLLRQLLPKVSLQDYRSVLPLIAFAAYQAREVETALQYAKEAAQIDPAHLTLYAKALLLAGQPQEALECLSEVEGDWRAMDFWSTCATAMRQAWDQGDLAFGVAYAAVLDTDRVAEETPGLEELPPARRLDYLLRCIFSETMPKEEELAQQGAGERLVYAALVMAAMNRTDGAFALLGDAITLPLASRAELLLSPDLAPLQDDSRWPAFCETAGISPDYLEASRVFIELSQSEEAAA